MKLELNGERIKLRKLKFSDVKDIYGNVKDKEVVRWTLRIPYPYPKDGAKKFIRKTRRNIKKKKSYELGIVLKEADKIIGIVGLTNIDYKNKNAELGYWLGKKYWNKGLMTEAVKLMLWFGFEKLKLHRVYTKSFEENSASRRVMEKSGLKLEGIHRETRFRYSKWHNEVNYGILQSEYKKK
jgi:RimJ/RimL family protein N-acetyltransferase